MMGLVNRVAYYGSKSLDAIRPILHANPNTIEHEKRRELEDRGRKEFIQDYVRLSVGGLDELAAEAQEEHRKKDPTINYWASYHGGFSMAGRLWLRPARVIVEKKIEGPVKEVVLTLAKSELKRQLHLRGANAGVYYVGRYGKGVAIAEAVPALLNCE